MFSPQPVQEEWFEKQIKLAIELNMPLFFHERDAHASFVNVVKKYPGKFLEIAFSNVLGLKGVVHCFTGEKKEVQKYLEMGFHIGKCPWALLLTKKDSLVLYSSILNCRKY
jgi:TatD DNase family protein